jgi:hypothetical protein
MRPYIAKQPKHQRERVEAKLDERIVPQARKVLRVSGQRPGLRREPGP